MLSVTQFTRKPAPGAFSIERVFRDIRDATPPSLHIEVAENRNLSKGVAPRLGDAIRAARRASAVNHVTGDVHYLTWFLPRRRTVLTIHDTIFVERETGVRRWLLWVLWMWLPVRRAARVVAISEASRRRVLNLVRCSPDKITVIPNPVSPEFQPRPYPPTVDRFRLLHVGTKPNKNLERTIEALADLNIDLTIVGTLTEGQRAALNRLGAPGRAVSGLSNAQLREVYANSHALIFASLDEGFGLPIIEAQATGRPVITSARAPMEEVAGGASLLVDPEDAADIRFAVETLMANAALRRRLVNDGLRNVRRFTPHAVATTYAKLYRQIADKAARD